jgi:hypothetical protein
MGANKLEKYEMRVVRRGEIHGAEYNPRKISEAAKKKLKRFLKKHGLWCPLTLNSKTGNLISGHQRLEIMDSILGPDYELTVAVGEVDETEEVKINLFMNNPSAQGEWDPELLLEIKEIWPDISFLDDIGFELEELEILGIDELSVESEHSGNDVVNDEPAITTTEAREIKQRGRDAARKENEDGNGTKYSASDFTLTFIFPDASSKREFLDSIGMEPMISRLNSQVLLNMCSK